MKKIKIIFENLENSRYPFFYFIMTFLCAINLRNFLESFSSNLSFSDFSLNPIIHFDLSYVCLALSLILFISLAVKKSVVKISRVVLTLFVIVISPPILDLIISGGRGYNIAYLCPDFDGSLVYRFFTFFGPMFRMNNLSAPMGVTPGMKIEIALVLVISLIYFLRQHQEDH